MSNLRRYDPAGKPVFVTMVTFDRRPILTRHADIVLCALRQCKNIYSSQCEAWVILPDHLHLMLSLRSASLSEVIHRLKMIVIGGYRQSSGEYCGRLWQKRFWDHIIRDEEDYRRHLDYIHYNPVHHRYSENPFDYPYSSAREFLEAGNYDPDWGAVSEADLRDFGE